MPEKMQLHTIISGRVHEVGFRYFVLAEARRLRLSGWVRNLAGGGVEVTAEGSRDALSELLAKLQSGPPAAWVAGVTTDWQAATGQFEDFRLAPTA